MASFFNGAAAMACLAAGVAAIGLAIVAFGTFQMRYALSLLLMLTPPLYSKPLLFLLLFVVWLLR